MSKVVEDFERGLSDVLSIFCIRLDECVRKHFRSLHRKIRYKYKKYEADDLFIQFSSMIGCAYDVCELDIAFQMSEYTPQLLVKVHNDNKLYHIIEISSFFEDYLIDDPELRALMDLVDEQEIRMKEIEFCGGTVDERSRLLHQRRIKLINDTKVAGRRHYPLNSYNDKPYLDLRDGFWSEFEKYIGKHADLLGLTRRS